MIYLAYGSNLNLEQMVGRCPNSEPIAVVSVLHDWELYFNLHADIRPKEGAKVQVGLWRIADSDWERLDMYEGYPTYYTKKVVGQYKGEDVIAYIMTDAKKERCNYVRPQPYYFHVIEQGYKSWGMDVEELYKAYEKQFGDRAWNNAEYQ